MDLSGKSIVELKALAYDYLFVLENTQRNLASINAEINRRMNASSKDVDNNKTDEKGS